VALDRPVLALPPSPTASAHCGSASGSLQLAGGPYAKAPEERKTHLAVQLTKYGFLSTFGSLSGSGFGLGGFDLGFALFLRLAHGALRRPSFLADLRPRVALDCL